MSTLPTRATYNPHPALQEIDESSLGPAMLRLTPRHRAFVRAKVLFGVDSKKAAAMAGYPTTSPHALEVRGYEAAHDPLVQEAMHEEAVKLMRGEGAKSLHTLIAIRDDTGAEPKDRIKCAVEILNRCGLHAMSEHKVSVEHSLSDAEKDRRILALCAELGLSESEAKKMLIAPLEAKKITDAEFAVIEPERALTDEERAAAAKREKHAMQERARRRRTPEEREAHRQQQNEERRQRGKREYAERKARERETVRREGTEDFLEGLSDPPASPETIEQEQQP